MMDTSREHSEPVRQCSVPAGGRISALTLYNVWARKGETGACEQPAGTVSSARLPAGIGAGGLARPLRGVRGDAGRGPGSTPSRGHVLGGSPPRAPESFSGRSLSPDSGLSAVCSMCFLSLWTDRYLSPGALKGEPREPVAWFRTRPWTRTSSYKHDPEPQRAKATLLPGLWPNVLLSSMTSSPNSHTYSHPPDTLTTWDKDLKPGGATLEGEGCFFRNL